MLIKAIIPKLNIHKTKIFAASAFILFFLCANVVLHLYENTSLTQKPSPLKYIMPLTSSLDNDVDDDYEDLRGVTSNGFTCSPKIDIYFLKTHKSASTTAQNIFMRYGLKKNLSFVLPRARNETNVGHPNFFNSKYVLPNKEMKFNIFCHHSRFQYKTIRELMPNDTVFLAIVRNPMDLFESAVHYFTRSNISLPNYIENVKKKSTKRPFYSQNPMIFDFGVKVVDDHMELEKRIRERIAQFDFILISDYFEESVILMKDLLCWSMEDVVYVILNKRQNTIPSRLSPNETKLVQEWNYGDELLYSMVNQTFWKRVQQFGEERMQSEITELRRLRHHWESRCIENQTTNEHIQDPRMKVKNPNAMGFVLKPERRTDTSCIYLVLPTLKFTYDLLLRQLFLYP